MDCPRAKPRLPTSFRSSSWRRRPIYGQHGGEEARLLAACYENSIALAAKHGLETIAFPAISTGVYGYPKDEAARVSRAAIELALEAHASIKEVRLVFFSESDARKVVPGTTF